MFLNMCMYISYLVSCVICHFLHIDYTLSCWDITYSPTAFLYAYNIAVSHHRPFTRFA